MKTAGNWLIGFGLLIGTASALNAGPDEDKPAAAEDEMPVAFDTLGAFAREISAEKEGERLLPKYVSKELVDHIDSGDMQCNPKRTEALLVESEIINRWMKENLRENMSSELAYYRERVAQEKAEQELKRWELEEAGRRAERVAYKTRLAMKEELARIESLIAQQTNDEAKRVMVASAMSLRMALSALEKDIDVETKTIMEKPEE